MSYTHPIWVQVPAGILKIFHNSVIQLKIYINNARMMERRHEGLAEKNQLNKNSIPNGLSAQEETLDVEAG